MSTQVYDPALVPPPPLAVHNYGGFTIYEETKCTRELVGATFAQNAYVNWDKNKSLMFAFGVSASACYSSHVLKFIATPHCELTHIY